MYSVLPANTVTAFLCNLCQSNNKSLKGKEMNGTKPTPRSGCTGAGGRRASRPAGRLHLLPLLSGAQHKSCWPRGVGQMPPMQR